MDSRISNLILAIVAAGALVFIGFLVTDYFSKASRAARRRKRHAEKRLNRARGQS